MTKFVEDTYAKIAQAYADAYFDGTDDLPFIEQLTSRLAPGSRVLDVGCGPGQFSKLLGEQGFAVQGIDNSTEMLVIARQKVPGVKFQRMDMRHLEYPDSSFDGLLAAYSIIHIPTPELPGVLAEFRRVLRVGGLALFITQQGEPDQIVDDPLAAGVKIFVNFFSKDRLQRLLSPAGLTIVAQGAGKQASEELLSGAVIWALARAGHR